ncbi:enoyl-CoA hydratase [Sulfitobacter sp. EhC04]|uniref:crotonase/enoyl-CoA hydratase family protein n=1 Tax=Sulfitobacter sp. EhC04 TaxID=1849168 RepID=UPI0007F3DFAD|nr:crotonase/enoyl-CoA hydratase family protein [Sulfitobacter sp. EhC04]OAN75663.1 enoyl-CoA hydratase [Sulfitobacter sp. EhC04]
MTYKHVTLEQIGDVLLIGIDRPEKANAFNLRLFHELSLAYAEFDSMPSVRVGVLHGVGKYFAVGMDLAAVAPHVQAGGSIVAPGGINPFQVDGQRLSKPLVAAVHGKCLTLGIELLLATDIVVCSESTTFAQLEPSLGLFPFGGVTLRLPRAAGWGNAMRWLLTSEQFDAQEAHRIGLVQEVVPDGDHLTRGLAIAQRIARQSPSAIRAVLDNARSALRDGEQAAEQQMVPLAEKTFNSPDGRKGINAFMSPWTPEFDDE